MMARYTYEVRYGPTPIVITDVQGFNITKGRKQIQDPFKAGSAVINGRNPTGLPNIEIGVKIEIWVTNVSPQVPVFRGFVADYRVNYGIVSEADTYEIICEDSFGAFGRALTSPTAGWIANQKTNVAADALALGAGLAIVNISGLESVSRMSAQSVPNTNLLNVLQQIMFTEQGRLINLGQYFGVPGLGFVSRAAVGLFPTTGAFTDGSAPTALFTAPFDNVQFNSQADSYFDEVVVEPEGLADQISGSGPRVFTGKSYDVDTTQARNLADYVRATLQVNRAVPQSLSCTSETQGNDVALQSFVQAGDGTKAVLILRGVTYNVFIEGGTMSADPNQARWTFNLVSSDAQNFFILDSPVFGRLDADKLGF